MSVEERKRGGGGGEGGGEGGALEERTRGSTLTRIAGRFAGKPLFEAKFRRDYS